MKINSLKLLAYGKFQNKTLELEDGINIIYGKNEAGKSTLMSFIRAMLYGFTGRGASVSSNERRKYIPWNQSTMAGEMDITTDDGSKIKLQRESGKTAGVDKLSAFDMQSGEQFEYDPLTQIGLGEEAFMKTLYIRQLSTAISGEDEEISSKLINLTYSGEEDVSYHKASQMLQAEMKKYRALRGDGGIIRELEEKISALNSELASAEHTRAEAFGLLERKRVLTGEIENYRGKLAELGRHKEEGQRKAEFDKLADAEKLVTFFYEEIKAVEKELTEVKKELAEMSAFETEPGEIIFNPIQKTQEYEEKSGVLEASYKSARVWKWVCLTLALLSAGAAALSVYALSGTLLFLALFAVFTSSAAKKKRAYDELLEKINSLKSENEQVLEALKKYNAADVKDYTEKRTLYNKKKQKAESLADKISTFEQSCVIAVLDYEKQKERVGDLKPVEGSYSLSELAEEEQHIREMIEKCVEEKSKIDGVLSERENSRRTPDIILTERAAVSAELDEALLRYEALALASDSLDEVFTQMSSDFTPRLNEKASQIISRITKGKYENLFLDKKYSVTMESEGAHSLAYFSSGTNDQVYMAVRLAVADILFGTGKPIFIDDGFLQYDEGRESATLEYLMELAKKGQQIIIFSCRRLSINEKGINVISL